MPLKKKKPQKKKTFFFIKKKPQKKNLNPLKKEQKPFEKRNLCW